MQRQAGIGAQEIARARRQHLLGDRVGGGDAQASHRTCQALADATDLGGMRRHRLDMRQHRLALPRRPADAVGGLEQTQTERTLDARQPAPDRGLVDAQPRAGAGISALVPDGSDDAQIVPVHRSEVIPAGRSLQYRSHPLQYPCISAGTPGAMFAARFRPRRFQNHDDRKDPAAARRCRSQPAASWRRRAGADRHPERISRRPARLARRQARDRAGGCAAGTSTRGRSRDHPYRPSRQGRQPVRSRRRPRRHRRRAQRPAPASW